MQSLAAGIDKLETFLPKEIPLRPMVAEIYDEARAGHLKGFGPGKLYSVQGDLRPYGIDAILHMGHKYDGKSSGKLEILHSGEKSWRENMNIVESVVDHEPLEMRTMRTDLTVDVDDVPVSWVLENGYVVNKRFQRNIREYPELPDDFSGHMDCMGTGDIQTIYSGKRPNLFRVYNKTHERLNEYRKATRGWNKKFPTLEAWLQFNQGEIQAGKSERDLTDEYWYCRHAFEAARAANQLPKPTFEQVYGYSENRVLTRFERQMSAKEVSNLHARPGGQDLRTLSKLKTNVIEFNPFSPLRFVEPGLPVPNRANYSPMQWHAGMNFQREVKVKGFAAAVAAERPFQNGHMASFLKSIKDFLPARDAKCSGITPARLYEMYRSTVEKQLAA